MGRPRPGTDPHDEIDARGGGSVIGAERALLDQGSIQFILLGVMILAVLWVLWITIAK
jgi:hypothetical protein